MNFSNKSIHARVYKFTYSSILPQNLCPYFWKLVFAFLVLIPNVILQLPTRIFRRPLEDFYDTDFKDTSNFMSYGLLTYFLSSLFLVVIGGLGSLILALLRLPYSPVFAGVGFCVVVLGIVVLLWKYIDDWRDDRNFKKEINKLQGVEEKPSLIKEFIKASYNKYCPKIKWD